MKRARRISLFLLLLICKTFSADYKVSDIYTGAIVKENSAALNRLIADKLQSGDRLIFDDRGGGVDYVFGSVAFVGKEGISIILEAGVTLQGSGNANHGSGDYDSTAEYALIYIKESRNISISGAGTIDGNCSDSTWLRHQKRDPGHWDQWWDCSSYVYKAEDESIAPNCCIYVKDCAKIAGPDSIVPGNISIEGITINRAYQDAIWLRRCNTVKVANVKINNSFTDKAGSPSYYGGGDGIDIDLSRNVSITNTDVISSDDAICIKSLHLSGVRTSYTSDNITVSGCNVSTPTNGLKIGTETCDNISNVRFINCTVSAPPNGTGPFGGVAIMATDGSHIRGVEIKDIRIHNAKAPIFVKVGNRMRFQSQNATSELSDISFEGITADIDTAHCSIASSITGYANGPVPIPVRNVKLRDITLTVRGGVTRKWRHIAETEVPEADTAYPQADMFQYRYARTHGETKADLPCYGIYFRNVQGLVMENVTISTLDKKPDIRPMFIYKDVTFTSSAPSAPSIGR
jgi:hypothetical protein